MWKRAVVLVAGILLVAVNAGTAGKRSGNLETLDAGEYEYLVKKRVLEDNYNDGYSSSNSNANYGSSSSYSSANYGSSSSYSNAYGTNFFVDSQKSYYTGYQQAWRYLGHMVKCGYPSSRYDEQNSHSEDEDGWDGNNWCQRYLVWAAYVDLNYQGGGIGEYYYYDTYSGAWDYSACKVHGNGRCAPMDCHLSDTSTWTLMGIFKEAEYFGNDAFFEQLFKHEGVCVWNNDDVYEFMSESRESAWPEGCVQTGSYVSDGSGNKYSVYIDLKPTYNGNMTYGLYLDQVCRNEYRGSAISVETVAKNMGLLYGSYLTDWNDALEIYKVCQPCMAYNLQVDYPMTNDDGYASSNNNNQYSDSSANGNTNSRKWWWWNRRLDDSSSYYDPNEGYFQCDDAADYTNVNQCMKFRSHAELEVASWEDLVIATEQGGILEVKVGGTIFGTEKMSYEQQIYLEEMRKAKEAAEEAEYKALLATVPSVEPMRTIGRMLVTLGPLALLAALYRMYKRSRRVSDNNLSEPLMIEETSGTIA